MSDLSDDRKRQIREEEEQRLRKIKADEDAYREQVRRELAGQPEPPPVEPQPVESPRVQAPPVARPPAPQNKKPAREPKPPRKPRPKKQRVILGTCMALGGAVLAYYAYYQGFPIPGINGPFKSTLTADATGGLTEVDKAEWGRAGLGGESWTVTDDGKVVVKPAPVLKAAPATSAPTGSTPPSTTPTTTTPVPEEEVPVEVGRTAIAGGKISVVFPSAWTIEEETSQRIIALRTLPDGQVLRFNLTDVSDRAGYSLAELHAQNVDYVRDWVGRGIELRTVDEDSNETLAGLTMSATVLEDPNAPGYYYATLTTISNGRAVWLIVDGPEELPREIEDEITSITLSLRLSR